MQWFDANILYIPCYTVYHPLWGHGRVTTAWVCAGKGLEPKYSVLPATQPTTRCAPAWPACTWRSWTEAMLARTFR